MKILLFIVVLLLSFQVYSFSNYVDYHKDVSTLGPYYAGLEKLKICKTPMGDFGYHKQLGKLRVAKVAGNKVYINDSRWYYLSAFKDCKHES